jgi:hypothetical protein
MVVWARKIKASSRSTENARKLNARKERKPKNLPANRYFNRNGFQLFYYVIVIFELFAPLGLF